MTPTRAFASALKLSSTWPQRTLPTVLASRQLSSSSTLRRGRDVLARYRPVLPLVSARDHLDTSSGSASLSDDFVTSSTQPVGTSFQTVPPPTSAAALQGSYQKNPVPAMVAPEAVSSQPDSNGLTATSEIDGTRPDSAQRRKEMVVQGVPVPPKPIPPGEEDCCMSGCVHCVYTIYADDLELYTEALTSAREALTKAAVPTTQWPDEIRVEESDGAGGVKDAEVKKVEESVDPSMAAFLA